MRELAKVTQVQGSQATVLIARSTACENCGNQCMVGKKNLSVSAKVENPYGARVGDSVQVEMETANMLRASAIAYGIPLAAFFIGCFSGYYWLAGIFSVAADIAGMVTGTVLLGASYLAIRAFDRKGAFKNRYKITIVG